MKLWALSNIYDAYYMRCSMDALILSNHSTFRSEYCEQVLRSVTPPAILVHGRIITNVTPMLVEDLQRAAGKVTSTSNTIEFDIRLSVIEP
jgi:hypothetical protein